MTALLVLAYAGARWPGPFTLLDNLSNFPAHFAAAFLASTVLLTCLRRLPWALAAAAGLALSLGQVLPWYFAGDERADASTVSPVRVLAANVLLHNREYGRLLGLVERLDPDVVGLAEVDARWIAGVAPLRARYPYHVEMPVEGYEGLALYSRLPLGQARRSAAGELPFTAIAATLRTGAGDVELILAHPPPPMGDELRARRNAQLLELARHVAASALPVVVAGDLNTTMWNRAYRPLEELAGLRNARAGHGIGPTWPALPLLGVPIDHVLATAAVRLENFEVMAGIGSDHLPVSAVFSLPLPQ